MSKLNSPYQDYIGIDVSKKNLDVCVRSTGELFQVSNMLKGFQALKKQLKPYPKALVILEGSGGYENAVVQFLQKYHMTVAVINPRQIRNFAKALGQLAKTDRINARLIAHFGEAIQPQAKALESQEAIALKELQQRRAQLVQMITMERNRSLKASPALRPLIRTSMRSLQKQLETIEKRLAEHVAQNPEWSAKKARLKAIQGVGDVTATLMIGHATHKEIAALVGVVPFNRDSGQFKGERSIFGGCANVRACLYMATLVGVKLNPILKAYYEKLCQAGKKKKVALVACMHKLLRIMNAMLKNNTAWQLLSE